jgi:hypothetical protein
MSITLSMSATLSTKKKLQLQLTKNEFPITSMELVRKKENKKLSLKKYPLGIDACLNIYFCYASNDLTDLIVLDAKTLAELEEELINAKVQIFTRIFKKIRSKEDEPKYSNLTLLAQQFNYFSIKTTEKILKSHQCKSSREYIMGLVDPFEFFLNDLNYKIKEINSALTPLSIAPIEVEYHASSMNSLLTTKKDLEIHRNANHSIHYVFRFKHKDKTMSFINKMCFVYIDNLNLDPVTYPKIPTFQIEKHIDNATGDITFTRERALGVEN